ncbi:hypothetical protein HISP_03385 [Haloarcula hispanica N601]|uniref:DUF63 domain-containing protein n=2 Tax=Haloarcula hispanica TaxID=51589 RepID=V5TIH5_HALHI|nr:DUF63 family protein [Haloarcula hispanica]AEM56280.1 conserved hypothetical protein [Haloarcula hispanica ATCC 33960]AHB65091.1 hypothetical protein HISP_03385 [Haloarcula hispanica N601]
MVLPSGLALPPLEYTVALLAGTLVVTALLYALEPPIDQRTVVALTPWMALGGALHAFHQPPIEAYRPVVAPLFGAPAVYLTTFVTLGVVWITLTLFSVRRGHSETISRNLGYIGIGLLTVLLVIAVVMALESGLLGLIWPTVAVVVATVVTAVTVLAVALWRTPVVVRMRYAAPTVVFAHMLDGVSTAVGADVIGITERTPIPARIMELAGTLPTAPYLGKGWLFVFVKLLVAIAVVFLLDDYLEEDPVEASLLLALVTAVGIGPATNNIVLFLFSPV